MLVATPSTLQHAPTSALPEADLPDTIETRLWLQEHDWLYDLLKSDRNVAPSFRFPDLISACVSVVFASDDASPRIFAFLGTELVFRPSTTARRRESMWRSQYELLLALQRSPANRHPNPKFQLDQLTTACVALSRHADASGDAVLRQARMNMAQRAMHRRAVPSN
ncbi:hypothetical protein [Sphaerotilus sp.]|uniref:hypothetical protein n=1 Tax=Sphaerotilus sp. TaxID=2093942 RepID=UPI002ACD29D6|nr:hypothetical protein [Sphaerotilus sp.]MDZ7855306.1 hypothetical protein [Sphaerotilus sp.]